MAEPFSIRRPAALFSRQTGFNTRRLEEVWEGNWGWQGKKGETHNECCRKMFSGEKILLLENEVFCRNGLLGNV